MELLEEQENEILGAVRWFHDSSTCNCSEDAPGDPEAYMSPACAQNYYRGVSEREGRRTVLRLSINAVADYAEIRVEDNILKIIEDACQCGDCLEKGVTINKIKEALSGGGQST